MMAVAPEGGERAARLRTWREEMELAQCAAVAGESVSLSCSAPLGSGGLGRHVQEILDALVRNGQPTTCIAGPGDASGLPAVRRARARGRELARAAGFAARHGVPLSPGARTYAFATEFDECAARRLPPSEALIAFNGQALTQIGVARAAGCGSIGLVSANSHMRRVARQHELARSRYPLEGSWTRWLGARNLEEYRHADRIYVASSYIRESFLEEGFPEELLSSFPLTPHRRYDCQATRGRSGRFEIVYSGSLAVHKGVPLLIDSFRRLAHTDMRLVLVGGWGTRGMRRFIEAACAADPRITAGAGDPLEALKRASLCVHPAYEDGFAYAPAEALVCGVPVIVSEDTGMKDMIHSPSVGLVLATGDQDALTEAIDAAYRTEIFSG
jgi:glycosyltransferase involved in cell wall biosynthesis